MSRDGWLVVHLLGVVLFLGNILVTAMWKLLADRTRAPGVVAYAQRVVTITDFAFTAPGVEHTFANRGDVVVRMLNVHAPAGFDLRLES